jgi:hypothetical protein
MPGISGEYDAGLQLDSLNMHQRRCPAVASKIPWQHVDSCIYGEGISGTATFTPMTDPEDRYRSAPAALRNREAILDVLRKVLPAAGRVLEVASGTGEHIVHFARHLPDLDWQPSDPSPEARKSILAWTEAGHLKNVHEPLDLDAAQFPWPVDRAAAIICTNMIHISTWEATVGLMRGAACVLPRGGPLYLYGPYRRADRTLEPSNEAFDRDLRARNARWGLRELDAVIACGAQHGLVFEQSIDMPANNLSVIFRKA